MRYEYEHSDIDWLDKKPKHWTPTRLAALGSFDKGRGIPKGDLIDDQEGVWAILYGDIYTKYDNSTNYLVNRVSGETAKSATEIQKGDLILAGSGETFEEIGKSVHYDSDVRAVAGGDIIIFRPLSANSQFLSYLLNSSSAIYQKASTAKGDIVVHTYSSKLRNIRFHLPPPIEQEAIANYLDEACERIDRVIEIKEEQIFKLQEHLKEKISQLMAGMSPNSSEQNEKYPWLPILPSNWTVTPMKRLLAEKLKYGANEAAQDEIEDHPRYIRITDFNDKGELKDDTFKSLPPEVAAPYYLKKGDILFARSGATVGKTFIFNETQSLACFAGYLIRARTKSHLILSDYLYYYTKTRWYDEWKQLIFTQATIQNIGADKYQYLPVIVPPSIGEQEQILRKIHSIIEASTKLEHIISYQLEKLKDYRSSLIHECVTGKKQVFKKSKKEKAITTA